MDDKVALLHLGVLFNFSQNKNQEIDELKSYQQSTNKFVNWIGEKYPEVWKKWKKE